MAIPQIPTSQVSNALKTQPTKAKLLTEEEYNKLSDEEKTKYIPYNPSMTDRGVAMAVAQANAMCEMLSQYGPMFEKMKVMPNPLPGEQLEMMVQQVEKMETLLAPIESLKNAPIIGQLVAPLVNLINSIFQVIGILFWLCFMLATGKDIFTDTITQTVKQVDWESLKKQAEDLKNMKTTASAENTEIDWDKIPTKEAKAKLQETIGAIEACYDSIQIVDSASRVYKKISETALVPYSWQAFKAKCLSVFEKLGIDFSALDQPSDADKEKFMKLFPDPSAISKEMAGKVNSLVQEKQYISIEDNERLKAKEEAKK